MSSGTLASPAQKPMATFGRGLELMAAMLASAGQRVELDADGVGGEGSACQPGPLDRALAGLKQCFGESRVDLMAYGRTPWS